MQETQVQSLGWEDLLEKEMVSHSSILAWKIPWMEEPGKLKSMGSQRVRHDWATSLSLYVIFTTNNPLSLVPFLIEFLLENGLKISVVKSIRFYLLLFFFLLIVSAFGLLSQLGGKESICQCRRRERCGFEWKWQPTPVFLPGKSHGQRSLADYSPWGLKESDRTEQLTDWWHLWIHASYHGVVVWSSPTQYYTNILCSGC